MSVKYENNVQFSLDICAGEDRPGLLSIRSNPSGRRSFRGKFLVINLLHFHNECNLENASHGCRLQAFVVSGLNVP